MTTDRLEATDPPPVKCCICGKVSRIASLVGENVCSAVCGWRAEGAAAERARIESIIDAYVAGRAAAEERWQALESRQTERDRAQGAMDVRAIIREGELPTTETDR